MLALRRKTRSINLGGTRVGGDAPITVQSMTNTDTKNAEATIRQIKELENEGCEIVRVAVPDEKAAQALKTIKTQIEIPLIADIHFDYRLALKAIEHGVDGLRINPGNIGGEEKVHQVVEKAKEKGVPIRIGVNAGSLEREIYQRYQGATPEAMVESALKHVRALEQLNFFDLKISLKASDVPLMVNAYRILADKVEYPLHLGVTEAGTAYVGSIKSAVGLGILLADGIGDTIRVSLTGDPRQEVKAGFEILKAIGLRRKGLELISCPTCGRCQIDLEDIAREVEQKLSGIGKPLKVAVMGCSVNGPGEAKEADFGIAGGKGTGLLFKKGKVIKRVSQKELVNALLKVIEKEI